MNLHALPVQTASPRSATIADELDGARHDRARLSSLLNEAFAELQASFSAIQAAEQSGAANADLRAGQTSNTMALPMA